MNDAHIPAMGELSRDWDPYFDALDPEGRLALLDILADLDGETAAFCRTLYQERYTHPKQPGRTVDNWLWKLAYLPGVYKGRKFLGRGSLRRELADMRKELHLDDWPGLGGTERAALYREFRNTGRRYLSTCKDPGYANKLLGMKKATEQEKLDHACEDIWMASKGAARAAGLEDVFQPWCSALYTELLAWDPGGGRRYEELDEHFKK